jgi:PPP family 3-phenylpropionic acid transporter
VSPAAPEEDDASRTLAALRVYYLMSFAALGAYTPFFPSWLAARGLHGAAMGFVSGLLPAMGVLAPPAIGIVADAFGARGLILRFACLGGSLAMGVLALGASIAAGAGATPVALVVGCVALHGAFRSPMVMLADVIAIERGPMAGTSYGKIRRFGSLGFLAAALVVGAVLNPLAPVALPALVSALLFVAFVSAVWLPAKPARTELPSPREARDLLGARPFVVLLVVSFLGQLAHVAYDLCFTLHLGDLGAVPATAGVAWAIGVGAEVVLLGHADRLVERFSARRLLLLALLGAAARWALIATLPLPALVALSPLHAISFALWWVASIHLLRDGVPPRALATAQGVFTTAVAAGSVLGMVVWGALYARSGGPAVFGCATGVSLAAAVVSLALQRGRDDLGEARGS